MFSGIQISIMALYMYIKQYVFLISTYDINNHESKRFQSSRVILSHDRGRETPNVKKDFRGQTIH